MAKVQNPVIGRTKGSAGGMTWAKVYDKNVMKAKVFEANNPKTPAQQVQRAFFKQVSAISVSLTNDQLRCVFPKQPKGISRRNAYFQQLAANWKMVGSEKQTDLAKLTSVGNASTMDFGITTCTVASGKATVGLDANVKANTFLGDNYFIAMLVNETKQQVSLDITNAKVSVGSIEITMPNTWEDTDIIHAIPLITDSKVALTSFGTILVSNRPERQPQNPRP